MKNKIAWTAFFLVAISTITPAQATDAEDSERPQIVVKEKIHNPDGSVTIKVPRLELDERAYPISYDNRSESVCKALGFTNALPYLMNMNGLDQGYNRKRAFFNSEGQFTGFSGGDYTSISSITCYNNIYKTFYTSSAVTRNADDSYTISRPQIQFGQTLFPIVASTNASGVCRGMGFERVLEQGVFSYNAINSFRLGVDSEGQVADMAWQGFESIDEITCVGAKETPQ